jgi:signal recognition particle subunit SRP19
MRKKNKFVIWSIYFDSEKTRAEGRRIPRNLAISSPKLDELHKATKKLGLQSEVVSDAAYPSFPWRKSGCLVIPKTDSKNKILQKIGKELYKLRK